MKKLFRSERDKKVTGLCGGLAQYLNVDTTLIRLIAVVAAFFSFGTVALIYIVASILVPKETFSSFNDHYDYY
ncbi:hypothetical protein C2I18_18800 [Paenibacillus sp. PK3_47]|uniref:PspC domain-containing protein n=1 Tax=Paenibacillus sp. PK3_47 TaxID=2072642 RepID=UPI00201E606D|nr:PspC domain-containing protein [Paenibacillus sp. PK3_47]UQZ35388.1 hypothetical protein C2I18_18800 [Paenibacillus sp. PK3_47]